MNADAAHRWQPVVSVVVPMLNERDRIGRCVASLAAQSYPLDRLEVLIVDGGSNDGSRDVVAELQAAHDWLRLVENPDRRASSAFNRGIEAARGEVVCLLSSHGEVRPDFVERSVAALEETGAAGVGGMLRHEGEDAHAIAIGLAMTSPAGMASPFRYATTRREVDTIGHPAYRRAVLDEVGPFDESLERNSDYEMNYRIRRAGHRLLFDPEIVTVYRPRGDLRTLARQFWSYGRWKAVVIRNQPGSIQVRHLAAPAAVFAVVLAPVLQRAPMGRSLLVAGAAAYGVLLAGATATAQPWRHGADSMVFVAAFPVMHASWGAGFLATILRRWQR